VQKDARVLVAEFLGTFALTFFGAASIVSAAALRAAELGPRATPINITRTFGTIDLLLIAFAHAIVLAVMVTALGHISGGHFNPAVTVGALIGRHIEPALAALYVVAQLTAGLVAALLIKYLFAADLLQIVKWGAPTPAVDTTKAVVVEAVLTFFLVLVVYATAIDPRGAFNKIAGFAIGLVLFFDILVGGPMTGAAMNPARAFGPALLAGIVDAKHFMIYWIGPLLGSALAAVLYQYVLIVEDVPKELSPPAEESSSA
jgi:MIP family channel proteins